MYCANCGTQQSGHEKYCKSCGGALHESHGGHAHNSRKAISSEKDSPHFVWQFILAWIIAIGFTTLVSILGFEMFPDSHNDGTAFFKVANLVTITFAIMMFLVYRFTKSINKYKAVPKVLLIPFILGLGLNILIQVIAHEETNKLSEATTAAQTENCNQQETLQKAKANTFLISRSDGGHGTGFAIKNDGFILTNYHVVEDTKTFKVWVNGEYRSGKLWASYPDSDLAVIKVDEQIQGLPFVGTKNLKVAEPLFAIGWPNEGYGDSSVTQGIYSRIVKAKGEPEFIQTDAAINPGNSGGPLLNACGVVGINTLKEFWTSDGRYPLALEGLGYAMSTDYVDSIIYKKSDKK